MAPVDTTTIVPPISLAARHLSSCSSSIEYDFEHGEAYQWENGTQSDVVGFTTFLGRLGQETPLMSKEFNVRTSSDKVVVEFEFYNIDGRDANDHFYVLIQGSRHEIQLTGGAEGHWEDPSVTGRAAHNQRFNIGYNYTTHDEKTTVKLDIGYQWYTSGTLKLGFEVDMADSIADKGAGIDNFKMSLVCDRRF
jgi:hypothetical protein